MSGDQHLRLRVLQHIAQTLVRIFEIKRCIGGSGLVDRQHGEWELLGTVEHDTHKVVGTHTEVDQLMSQRIGVAVHLSVGQLAVLVHHSGGVWGALSLFGEEVGKGLAQVHVDLLACADLNDALSLFVADDADACQGSFGLGDHPLCGHLDSVGQTLHQTL